MEKLIAVLPGDGIGPEVVAEGIKVLDAIADVFGHRLFYAYGEVGGEAYDNATKHMSDEEKKAIKYWDKEDKRNLTLPKSTVELIKKSQREEGNVLELSKDLDNVSISKDFYFDVNKGATSLAMEIRGTLNEGELTITVKKPNGDLFQEFQVSPLADVNWNQQIDLKEEDDEYEGKWTVTLSGTGASGDYNIRIKSK